MFEQREIRVGRAFQDRAPNALWISLFQLVNFLLHSIYARIDLRAMLRKSVLATLCASCLLAFNAAAQSDSAAIGGPDETNPYDELLERNTELGEELPSLNTHEDSLRLIPAYEAYGDWNTDAIFSQHEGGVRDTVTLRLTYQACDNHLPICGEVNSPFGPRRGRMHYGVDIDLEKGDPVVCAFEGMVRISRYHRQFGNVVVVRHPNGLETLYGHLSERLVQAGDAVEAGQLLGLGGSTGRSTGDHLHFETRYLGQPIDPQFLFDIKEGELKAESLHVHPGLFTIAKAAKARLKYYTVRRGDTLSAIARRNGTTVQRLKKINRVGSGNKLRVGQRIRLH
jgi:murein DD-endopeptidase MepM/ murein hydrolase activator NlpD